MLALKKIAITGSLASGKSTVAAYFKELGAYVLDADKIVHDLLDHRKDIQNKIISLLGQEIVIDGVINRKKIADLVFQNPLHLAELEKILHPEVRLEIKRKWHEVAKQKKHNLFVVEIPLLFETEPQNEFDCTLVVKASKPHCVERFSKRTHLKEKDYELRMKRQLSIEEKVKRADFTLENDQGKEALKEQVRKLYNQLTS